MAAYYFSSITLDGQSLSSTDIIRAYNESSGALVGVSTYENVGNGYTEVLVYGEEAVPNSDETFGTDGYMQSGQTPQFYVNDIKAHYVAANGDALQSIPAFSSTSINVGVTLNLVSDCNSDMGGAASIDSCDDCWGGGTDINSADLNDPDSDTVCNAGAENGEADNCPDTANSDQANYDGDSEGDVCDSDDDNDGALDENDTDDNNVNVCSDTDSDNCDDCTDGMYDV